MANGTLAIETALKALGIQPGDAVIVTAYTWEGTVGPVLLLNGVAVLVDINPDTYCLGAKRSEEPRGLKHPATEVKAMRRAAAHRNTPVVVPTTPWRSSRRERSFAKAHHTRSR